MINKKEDTTKNANHKGEEFRIVHLEEDAEMIKIPCCSSLKITSKGRTKLLYRFLLGEYRLVSGKNTKAMYKKRGQNQLYISRPKSHSARLLYSWGVSHTPEAKWGYIRSGKTAPCPDMAGEWMVYLRSSKRWTRDTTLSVKCKPRF